MLYRAEEERQLLCHALPTNAAQGRPRRNVIDEDNVGGTMSGCAAALRSGMCVPIRLPDMTGRIAGLTRKRGSSPWAMDWAAVCPAAARLVGTATAVSDAAGVRVAVPHGRRTAWPVSREISSAADAAKCPAGASRLSHLFGPMQCRLSLTLGPRAHRDSECPPRNRLGTPILAANGAGSYGVAAVASANDRDRAFSARPDQRSSRTENGLACSESVRRFPAARAALPAF